MFPTYNTTYSKIGPYHMLCGLGMALGISVEAIKEIIKEPSLCQRQFMRVLSDLFGSE